VARIPVIAEIAVMCGPVSAQADEEIFAVIVRIHIPE
jgi:hypothetical protein